MQYHRRVQPYPQLSNNNSMTNEGTRRLKTKAPPTKRPATLADVQLATATATAGQHLSAPLPQTGSPYGQGLLVGVLLLLAAGGMGITYRRFAGVKVRR